ncbi:MAG: plasmid-related protein [Pseudomonadota bacterium]
MGSKDAGMRIRIERELRDAFVAACQSQGLVAAEVLRDFMRGFAAKHSNEQAALFAGGPGRSGSGS